MHYRLSGATRKILLFNFIITVVILCIHLYSIYKINESNKIIVKYMVEHTTDRNTAINYLIRDGADIVVDGGFFALFGVFSSLVSIYYTHRYIRTGLIHHGVMVALFSFLTNFIGGILLFYIILSGKSENYNKGDPILKDNDE